jgi:ribosomal protein S27AE
MASTSRAVCPRCGNEMNLVIVTTVMDRTTVEWRYTCPRCGYVVVAERMSISRRGRSLVIDRELLKRGEQR